MKQIEKHPAPEKLLQQITEEAINALALGGPDKIGDEAPMEAGVKLIAKAWEVPRESLQASLELIERERQLLRSGSSEDALPNSELLKPYDGKMIAELLWPSCPAPSWSRPVPGAPCRGAGCGSPATRRTRSTGFTRSGF